MINHYELKSKELKVQKLLSDLFEELEVETIHFNIESDGKILFINSHKLFNMIDNKECTKRHVGLSLYEITEYLGTNFEVN